MSRSTGMLLPGSLWLLRVSFEFDPKGYFFSTPAVGFSFVGRSNLEQKVFVAGFTPRPTLADW